jgi:hypothetical protein
VGNRDGRHRDDGEIRRVWEGGQAGIGFESLDLVGLGVDRIELSRKAGFQKLIQEGRTAEAASFPRNTDDSDTSRAEELFQIRLASL